MDYPLSFDGLRQSHVASLSKSLSLHFNYTLAVKPGKE